MVILVVLVAVIGLLCYAFYSWARRRGMTGGAAALGKDEHAGHVSVLTEAVGYVGVVLVLAGGIAAISRRWGDISDWGHVGVFAAAAALFVTVGALLFGSREPALRRLVGVLWCGSVAGVAGAVGFATHDVWGASAQLTALIVGLVVTAYSAALWLLRRQAPQNVALFVGLVVTICGTISTLAHGNAPSIAFMLPLWAFGLAWALAGRRRWMEPVWITVPLGLLLTLVAPSVALADHGWVYVIAIVTAAAVMAASVPLHNTPMLALGTIGLFGYVTSMVTRYFADSLGVPTALALTGALVLVLATVGTQLLRRTKRPKPESRIVPAQPPVRPPVPVPVPVPGTRAAILRDRVEQYRRAYERRDVDGMLAVFADAGEFAAAPGTFHGQDEVRRFLEWDATSSPAATVSDTGVGVLVSGNRAVWERVISLSYKDVPYEEHSVAVIEFDDDARITAFRSYYDKPNELVGVLTSAGSKGLTTVHPQ